MAAAVVAGGVAFERSQPGLGEGPVEVQDGGGGADRAQVGPWIRSSVIDAQRTTARDADRGTGLVCPGAGATAENGQTAARDRLDGTAVGAVHA